MLCSDAPLSIAFQLRIALCGHWHGSNIPKYAAHEDYDEAVNCEPWLQSLAAEDGVGADE